MGSEWLSHWANSDSRAATGSELEIQYLPLVILEDNSVHSNHEADTLN